MEFEMLLKKANVPDQFGRVYPLEELQKILKEIDSRQVFGVIVSPERDQFEPLNVEAISHVITNARFLGDELFVTVKILESPMGSVLKTALEVKPLETVVSRIAMAGHAKLEIGELGMVVQDYSLARLDLVLSVDE